jgi:hypothetical protein
MGKLVSDTTTGAYFGAKLNWSVLALSHPAYAGAHLSSLPDMQHTRHHAQVLFELVSGHTQHRSSGDAVVD